jgi:hypothetical protein
VPPFEKGFYRTGCGATIFLSFAFQRAKKVLFANLLLNHILYPALRENALSGVASLGKNSGLPLNPLPLFGEKGKRYRFFGFAGGFPG